MCDEPKHIVDEWYDFKPSEEAKRLVNEHARAMRRASPLTLPKEVVERYRRLQMSIGEIDLSGGYTAWGSETNDQQDGKD
ncbi:hypothetical protein [Glutamicibacter nicotianae]|uniref:hypothetical protein n=1 Tax=Glutamicibacter nicotianae TaxID=37929 RepID=UPI003079D9E1